MLMMPSRTAEAGDTIAVTTKLERQYEQYSVMLYRLSAVMLGNRADAEDAVQNAFMRLWTKAPTFRDDEHEKAWLLRVTANICKDMLKSAWRTKIVPLDSVADQGEETEMEPSAVLEKLFTLPPRYRSALYLHYYEGYPVRQLAKLLDAKESTAKVWLHRGRELLRLTLEGGEGDE